ncbi:MAG: MvaI/BcnI family restriction endonuclease [Alphaproteobacteria bacterium]|nr:MvaI/BcnI family restriction endonuclease [Alphaproteobacteria bacterium]
MSPPQNTSLVIPPSGKASFRKIAEIIKAGMWEFPANGKYNGHGGPGRLLEDLLGIKENNADSPDLADWEIKFHGGTSLLTLFHKDPQPRGVINQMVHDYGWEDEHGHISFRHTIASKSPRGFYIVNEDGKLIIKNEIQEGAVPHWLHNTLFNAFSAKLRRLIVVHGAMLKNPRRVVYQSATAYWEPDIVGFTKAVEQGVFYVDFDARTKAGRGSAIRNHGTKFRIKLENLPSVYSHKLDIPVA